MLELIERLEAEKVIKSLSPIQARIVQNGCFSGDFTMATVNALKRKGLFHLVINSPNGRFGFMEPTERGKSVQEVILSAKGGEHE